MRSRLPAGLKKTSQKFGNGRYIKMDGTGWHAAGLRAHFQSAAAQSAIAAFGVMGACTASYGLSHPLDWMLFAGNLTLMGIAALHARNQDASITAPHAFWYQFTRFAIDTEGRAFPPQEEMSLLEEVRGVRANSMRMLVRVTPAVAGFTTLGFAFSPTGGGDKFASPGLLLPALAMAPMILRDIFLVHRCNKLLHPDHPYRFAANPPPAPAPQLAEAPAGAKARPL